MNSKFSTKIVVISIISIILIVSLALIKSLIDERLTFRSQAKQTIAESWSGPQTFAGPMIYASFSEEVPHKYFDKNLKEYVESTKVKKWTEIIIPENLEIESQVKTHWRKKGLYEVPLYITEISLKGYFSNTKAFEIEPDRVQLIVGMSHRKGLEGVQKIFWNGTEKVFEPGIGKKLLGGHLSVSLSDYRPGDRIDFTMKTQLRGIDELNFVPNAKVFLLEMKSDWAHPNFSGDYAPLLRDISGEGFSASWSLSNYATAIDDAIKSCAHDYTYCSSEKLSNAVGVGFLNPVDIYKKSERSIKYGFMFILLTFAIFFLIECLQRLSIHPVQYTLVGAALVLFYLVLTAFSEHLNFNIAYFVATVSCIALIGTYLTFILNNSRHAVMVATGLTALYALLFFVLKSEDYALLMGTMLTFGILAIVMFTTRDIDWYKITDVAKSSVENSDVK